MIKNVLILFSKEPHFCESCKDESNILYNISGDLGDWEVGGFTQCMGHPPVSELEVVATLAYAVGLEESFVDKMSLEELLKYLEDKHSIKVSWEKVEYL